MNYRDGPRCLESRQTRARDHLLQAADALCAGKGAIIVLDDSVAVAQDISWLENYRINKYLYQSPLCTRDMALTAAVQQLKKSVCAQYERSLVFNGLVAETNAGVGSINIHGVFIPGSPVMGEVLHERYIQQLSQRVEETGPLL